MPVMMMVVMIGWLMRTTDWGVCTCRTWYSSFWRCWPVTRTPVCVSWASVSTSMNTTTRCRPRPSHAPTTAVGLITVPVLNPDYANQPFSACLSLKILEFLMAFAFAFSLNSSTLVHVPRTSMLLPYLPPFYVHCFSFPCFRLCIVVLKCMYKSDSNNVYFLYSSW